MLFLTALFTYVTFCWFHPIFTASEVVIYYGLHPFDICSKNPDLWKLIKILYAFCSLFSHLVIAHFIYVRFLMRFSFFKATSKKQNQQVTLFSPKPQDLCLLIGEDLNHQKIYLPESRSLSKFFSYWHHWFTGKRLVLCILLQNN